MNRVVHLTSVHPRYDTRIFFKECRALVSEGYTVSLVVADGMPDEEKHGVTIVSVPKPSGRFNRMVKTTRQVYRKGLELDGEVYHIHDPELIPMGLKLRKKGKKVIFDIHEIIFLQILSKPWLHPLIRRLVSFGYRMYEKRSLKRFDALDLAEKSYNQYYQFPRIPVQTVLNMPQVKEFDEFFTLDRTGHELFYIGGITRDRGLEIILQSVRILKENYPHVLVHFVGPISDELKGSISLDGIEDNVIFHGRLPLYEGFALSKGCVAGLSILKPIPNYLHSYSTKIFEYMSAGLPVITSNFQLYRDVVERLECGLCVNPEDPADVARAVEYIFTHPQEARIMGEKGKRAVGDEFNWEIEQAKLAALYQDVLRAKG